MEVRCPSCNKLFRVSDDKIQGSGVKFGCSRCSTSVKITREDFERYRMTNTLTPAPARLSARPVPASKIPVAAGQPLESATAGGADLFDLSDPASAAAEMGAFDRTEPAPTAAVMDAFDLSEPAAAAAAMNTFELGVPATGTDAMDEFDLSDPAAAAAAMKKPEEEIPSFLTIPDNPPPAPDVAEPAPKAKQQLAVKVPSKPAPVPQPKAEPAAPVKPKQDHARPPSAPAAAAAAAGPARDPHPAPPAADFYVPRREAAGSSGIGKKAAILAIAVILIGSMAAGAWYYLERSSQKVSDAVQNLMTPEGLQVRNASGAIDPVLQDLVVSGVIENATDKPKAAWYILVEVYDAQGTVITGGRFLSGKQLYTRRDYEIMAKRGENVQEIKLKQLQEQRVTIPAHGSVSFEMRIMEPPVGIASFNAILQPFDPVQLHKELSEEQN